MMLKILWCTAIAGLLVWFIGCTKSTTAPNGFEVYKFFDRQLGQMAKAGGYVNYKVNITRLQQAAPQNASTPEGNQVTCFPIKVDRVEYMTAYHETYVTTFTNDEYRLYRDEDGRLQVLDHKPGQSNTVQRESGGM